MSGTTLSVGVAQIATGASPADNLVRVRYAIADLAGRGARVVLLPEASLVRFGVDPRPHAEALDGPWASSVREAARQHGVVALVGTFTPAGDRVRNTILVTGDDLHTGYEKIHLYDAYSFVESAAVEPGDTPLVFEVDGITVGVATCYDVRFPELFRELADRGADVVLVTAHWGVGEGKIDAWRLLNRARALDATTWIVACDQADASQAGIEEPPGTRFGVGHSLVVSPLGQVLAELDEGEGHLLYTVDIDQVREARKQLPILANRRLNRTSAAATSS